MLLPASLFFIIYINNIKSLLLMFLYVINYYKHPPTAHAMMQGFVSFVENLRNLFVYNKGLSSSSVLPYSLLLDFWQVIACNTLLVVVLY